jgi:pilus assembly protein Flp/PilA
MEAGRFLHALLQDESGVTAIEYGLLAALIVVAIIGSVRALSSEMITMYEYISSTIDDAINN